MRPTPMPSRRPHPAVSVGGWAAELTVRRFVDLGRTQSMMCLTFAR